MKSVYILLSRTRTVFARLMHFATADEFTHASLALDADLGRMYSFARKHDRVMLPAGLVAESLHSGVYRRNPMAPCALYELTIPDNVYSAIELEISYMLRRSEDYHYNFLGVLLCRASIARERRFHYFCSEFVGDILHRTSAATLQKPAQLMRPNDFSFLPELREVYRGPLYGCTAVSSVDAPVGA